MNKHLIPVSKRLQSEHWVSKLLLWEPESRVSGSYVPHLILPWLGLPRKEDHSFYQHLSNFYVMTAKTPPWIFPENSFMKENYSQTKLKGDGFQQKFPVICQKEIPTVFIVKLWCLTPNLLFSSLSWAEIVLVTAAEPHPHSRISMESGGRHHETWNIAIVLKGQSGREWEIFMPQISKRYFRMQMLRGWFSCQKLETSLKKIKGKVLKSFYRKKINFSHL